MGKMVFVPMQPHSCESISSNSLHNSILKWLAAMKHTHPLYSTLAGNTATDGSGMLVSCSSFRDKSENPKSNCFSWMICIINRVGWTEKIFGTWCILHEPHIGLASAKWSWPDLLIIFSAKTMFLSTPIYVSLHIYANLMSDFFIFI